MLTLIIKSDLQFPMSQILSTQIKSEPWRTAFLPLKLVRCPAKEWGTPKSLGALSNFSEYWRESEILELYHKYKLNEIAQTQKMQIFEFTCTLENVWLLSPLLRPSSICKLK